MFNELLPAWPSSAIWQAVLILSVAAAAHALARIGVRRWPADPAAADRSPLRWWIGRSLDRAVAPVGALIWVHGAAAVAALVLPRLPATIAIPSGTAVRWIYALAVSAALFWLLARMGAIAEAAFTALSRRSDNAWDDLVLPLAGTALRHALPLVALMLAAAILDLSADQERVVRNAASIVFIALVAWMLVRIVNAAAEILLQRHRIDVGDNLQARAVHTQVVVLKKVAHATIAVFTVASMLMVFDSVRQFGASILASAGIAGIVIGLAAQRSVATLLAGFQIALTQPIRVDDVVIVENEWGRIEDITLTYVVVRLWDLRRLIVPITYFIEQPFQNWTRSSADLLGAVTLHVDYSVSVEALRGELTRILHDSPRWDGKVDVLQVTDAKEHTLEIRALASAADAGLAWDLRCEIREKLVAFLQRTSQESLPRLRATLEVAERRDAS